MTLYRSELVCTTNKCGYEVVVANAIYSAYRRALPDECQRCGSELKSPRTREKVVA